MEPIVFHPEGNKEEPAQDNEITKTAVADNTTPEAQQQPTVMSDVTAPTNTSANTEPADETTLPPEQIPESPHKEILPSLAIPPSPPAKHKGSSKKKFFAVFIVLAIAAAGAFGALQLLNKKDSKTLVADPSNKEISELRIGSTYPPFTSFYPDPNFLGGSFGPTMQLYEGLTGFEGGNSIVPLVAQKWSNPDEKTWVFTLKPNVKFHNGKAVTAADVKASIETAVNDENTLPLLVSSIESVEVRGDSEITIKTKDPDPILLNKLAYIFIQSSEKVNGFLAGTGAYVVSPDNPPTDKELHLVAFDDYHGGKRPVRKASYIGFENEEAMLAAAKKGEIDVTDLFLETQFGEQDVAGYKRQVIEDGYITYIGVVNTKSPLNKQQVREALKLSIDAQTFITDSGVSGKPASQFTLEKNFGYNPELKPVVRDVAKAKQLLAQAGFPRGVQIKVGYQDSPRNAAGFNSLKKQAAEAGITLVAEAQSDFDAHLDKTLNGSYQLFMISAASALIDSYDMFAFNVLDTNIKNTTFFDELSKSNAEFNASERKKQLQQISKQIMDEVLLVPLVESQSAFLVRDTIEYPLDTGTYVPGNYIRNILAK